MRGSRCTSTAERARAQPAISASIKGSLVSVDSRGSIALFGGFTVDDQGSWFVDVLTEGPLYLLPIRDVGCQTALPLR